MTFPDYEAAARAHVAYMQRSSFPCPDYDDMSAEMQAAALEDVTVTVDAALGVKPIYHINLGSPDDGTSLSPAEYVLLEAAWHRLNEFEADGILVKLWPVTE